MINHLDKINKILSILKVKNDPSICVFILKFENNYGITCNILDESGDIIYDNEEVYKLLNKSIFFHYGRIKDISAIDYYRLLKQLFNPG